MGASASKTATTTNKRKETTVETNHPLAHLVPDKEIFGGENYIHREFNGFTESEVLEQAFNERHNVLIYGPTGPGKTSAVYAFASEKNLPVVNVPCNGAADPSYFIGGWQPQSDKSLDFVAGDVLLAVQHGGIIYLDEVNFLPPKIASYLHSLLDKRRTVSVPQAQGSSVPSLIKAHEHCFVVAAYNPDYEGTRPLNKAFRNRFKYKMHFDYERKIEDQLLASASLLDFAVGLRDRFAVGELNTPISTNLLVEFEELCESSLGFDYAVTNFLSAFDNDEQEIVREVLLMFAKNIWSDICVGEFESSSVWSGYVAKEDPQPAVPTHDPAVQI